MAYRDNLTKNRPGYCWSPCLYIMLPKPKIHTSSGSFCSPPPIRCGDAQQLSDEASHGPGSAPEMQRMYEAMSTSHRTSSGTPLGVQPRDLRSRAERCSPAKTAGIGHRIHTLKKNKGCRLPTLLLVMFYATVVSTYMTLRAARHCACCAHPRRIN